MGRVAILGGYTSYGRQIGHYLAKSRNIKRLLIAGRDVQRAAAAVHKLNSSKAQWTHADLSSIVNFTKFLYHDQPDIVINVERTQEPEIAKICLEKGVHYIDVTDSTEQIPDQEKYEKLQKDLLDRCVSQNILCVTETSLNPGITSAIISELCKEFELVEQCDIYITPDEGLAQNVFDFVGQEGSFRNLTTYNKQQFGQSFEPIVEVMKETLKVPEINLFYSFQSRKLSRFLQFLSYFPNSNKDAMYERVLNKTQWLENQDPNLEIVVKGRNLDGEADTRVWNLFEHNYLTAPSVSSVAACIVVEKILAGEIPTGQKMPCIDLFNVDEIVSYLKIYHDYDDTPYIPSSTEFETTSHDIYIEQLMALCYWVECTHHVTTRAVQEGVLKEN